MAATTNSCAFLGEATSLSTQWACEPMLYSSVTGWITFANENIQTSARGENLRLTIDDSTVENNVVEIFCEKEDAKLLTSALRANLRVYGTGTIQGPSQCTLVILERMQFWSQNVSEEELPELSTKVNEVGLRIMESARAEVLQSIWSTSNVPMGRTNELTTCHPILQRSMPTLLALTPKILGATLFLAQREALKATGTSLFWCSSVTRLGSSSMSCSHSLERVIPVQQRENGLNFNFGGAVVFGSDPSNLLDSAVAFAHLRNPRERIPPGLADTCPNGTVIIAPRFALTMLADSLAGTADIFASDLREYREQRRSMSGAPRLVALSLELVSSHNPTKDTHWSRCIYVGWPQTADTLQLTGNTPRAVFSVGLSHATDIYEGLFKCNTLAAAHKLASLMKCPNWTMGSPETLSRCIRHCVFSMDSENNLGQSSSQAEAVIPYSVEPGPFPDEDEEIFRRGATGVHRNRSIVFPKYASLRGPFRRVAEGVDSIRAHFERSGTPITHFTSRSIGEPGDSETRECPICYEDRADTVTACGHWFCASCLRLSLDHDPQCPICKTYTLGSRDVVSVGNPPSLSVSIDACLPHLANMIQKVRGKTIVIASFSELHEKVCKGLRSLNVSIFPWSGSASQVMMTAESFRDGKCDAILIDPSHVSCRWSVFCGVEEVIVLFPIYTKKRQVCCQVKEVVDACSGLQPKVTFVVRQRTFSVPVYPTCTCRNNCQHRRFNVKRCARLVRT